MSAYRIEVKSQVLVEPLTPGVRISSKRLAALDGLRLARELADNLAPELTEFGISGGTVCTEWNKSAKALTAIAVFLSPARLTKTQEKNLLAEVRGQYSDGFAEGGVSVRRSGMRVTLWLDRDRKLKLTQVASDRRAVVPSTLLQPSRLGNLKQVEYLISNGARVNASGAHGTTALINAIRSNHEAIVRRLLAAGARADQRSLTGKTPLQHACMCAASMPIHRLLLQAGAAVNAFDAEGRSALHWAANRGLLGVSRLLIEHGANVNAQDAYGDTPLMFATAARLDVIRLLLATGARTGLRNDRGQTAAAKALEQAEGYDRMGNTQVKRARSERRKAKVIADWQTRRRQR